MPKMVVETEVGAVTGAVAAMGVVAAMVVAMVAAAMVAAATVEEVVKGRNQ